MLLRRITKHVKDQNWFAVFLDFFIVIAGILIAFQITNWNEARGDRAAEAEYVLALEVDIKDSIAEIAGVTALSQKQEKARQTLYAYSNGDGPLAPEKFPELIEASLWAFPSVELRQTTFNTLSSSGRLGVLADKKLVAALQELAALIEEAETEKQHELYALERFGDPILYEHVDMSGVFRESGLVVGVARVPWIKEKSAPTSIPEIVKTQQFRNAILFRSALTNERMETYERLRLKYLEIGEHIDARQNKLGIE